VGEASEAAPPAAVSAGAVPPPVKRTFTHSRPATRGLIPIGLMGKIQLDRGLAA
jgi:hypothetical protein